MKCFLKIYSGIMRLNLTTAPHKTCIKHWMIDGATTTWEIRVPNYNPTRRVSSVFTMSDNETPPPPTNGIQDGCMSVSFS
jgi:hypothetical protein